MAITDIISDHFLANFFEEDIYISADKSIDVSMAPNINAAKEIEIVETNVIQEKVEIKASLSFTDVLIIGNYIDTIPANVLEAISKMMTAAKVSDWKCVAYNLATDLIDHRILVSLGVEQAKIKTHYLINNSLILHNTVKIDNKTIYLGLAMEVYLAEIEQKKIFWNSIKDVF